MIKNSSEERAAIFEDTLGEFIKEFADGRIQSTYCSEADIRVNLAHRLLSKLPARDVHAELPVPLDVERFPDQLWGRGRVSARRGIKADIAIIDSESFYPQVIVELKFMPLQWGFAPLLQVLRSQDDEFRRTIKEALQRTLNFLEKTRLEKPKLKDIERYFGPHQQGPTTVEKMIQIANNFKMKEHREVKLYLCVFDELYPKIQEFLEEAIESYRPPDSFKIIAEYTDVSQALEDTLKELR
jgi:hypothetical protein